MVEVTKYQVRRCDATGIGPYGEGWAIYLLPDVFNWPNPADALTQQDIADRALVTVWTSTRGWAQTYTRKITHRDAFIGELQQHGYRAARVDDSGINVWREPGDRYPADTVWWRMDMGGIVWGGSFQHFAPFDIDPEELVRRVYATIV